MLFSVKLTNAHTVCGRPTLKNSTECFRNGLFRELKGKQRKLSRHSMTSKTYGPHRRNEKSKYQECTCKIDKSLNREIFKMFVSSKICKGGYQSGNGDCDFCNGEHNKFPVSVAGCQPAALKHGIRNPETETERNTESNINDRKLKNFTLHNLVQSKKNLF